MSTKVNITELRNLAVNHRLTVDVWEVQKEAIELYEAIILFGIDNVEVSFVEGLIEKSQKGKNISKRSRALGAYLIMNMYQFNDSATSICQLNEQYGISIELALSDFFKGQHVTIGTDSYIDIFRKYIGKECEIEKHEKEIFVENLYNLVMNEDKTNIDLLALWLECENLYKSIIAVGIEQTRIWFYDHKSGKVSIMAHMIPQEMRALALLIVVHMYRFRDNETNMFLLAQRYKLPTSVRSILGNTSIYKDSECVSLSELVGRYLGEKSAGKFNNKSIINLQQAYNAIVLGKGDEIDGMALWKTFDTFYKMSKILGADNIKVKYKDDKKQEIIQTGREIPEIIKIHIAALVIQMYGMSDSSESKNRLAYHLGLQYPGLLYMIP